MLNFLKGMQYILFGFTHLLTPGLKRYIILPIAFNCLLFTILCYLSYEYLFPYAFYYIDKLPSWLNFLSSILTIIFIFTFILFFAMTFTVMFNVIAAPFNGLLAEKTQKLLYGKSIASVSFAVMVYRTFKRQGKFLKYFIPRFLGMCILYFIPFLHLLFPFIWFVFIGWMLSIQFQDLPMDNNLISFDEMKYIIETNTMCTLGFGFSINLANFIPFINIIVMPAAVIGGTMLYCDTQAPWVKQKIKKINMN